MKNLTRNSLIIALVIFIASCGGGTKSEEVATNEEASEATEAVEVSKPKYSGETAIGVFHKVADVPAWINAYKEVSDPESRIGYFVGKDDPNLVVAFEWTTSHEDAKAMFASEEMQKTMSDAGVEGEVNYVYYDVEEYNESEPLSYIVGISHEVKDYAAWKEKFDADLERRTTAGLRLEGLGRGPENPNMVYVLFSTDDLDKAMEMINSEELKKIMEEAGVVSEPNVSVWTNPPSAT